MERFHDSDDKISEKLFRLPKRLRSASKGERKAFVDELWRRTYEKLDDDDETWEVWEHIELNPIFQGSEGGPSAHAREGSHIQDYYHLEPRESFNTSMLPQLRLASSKDLLESFWRSMFVTYPPVTRIQRYYTYRPYSLKSWESRNGMLIRRTGMSIGELWDRMKTRRFHVPKNVWLWPEKAYLESLSDEEAEDGNEAEADDEDSDEESGG